MVSNIKDILESDKCIKCGACVAICPVEAIHTKYNDDTGFYKFSINSYKCINCKMCSKVCPKKNGINRIDKINFNNKDYYLGNYENIFLAHSLNEEVRKNSTSGGVINSIIRYMIDTKKIDEAIVVCEDENQKNNSNIISINSNNIHELEKKPRKFSSRYISIPVVSYLKNIDLSKKYLLVGTACQIKATKNFVQQKKIDNIFLIGICCSGAISFKASQFVMNRHKSKKAYKIFYRGCGWPGKNSLYYKVNKEKKESVNENHLESLFNSIFTSQIFKNYACRNCRDHFAEESDISFFDFWNQKEISNEKIGKSGIIVRNIKGKEIIEGAIKNKYIKFDRELNRKSVVESQRWILTLKKNLINKPILIKFYYTIVEFIVKFHIYNKFKRREFRLLTKVFFRILKKYESEEGEM